MSRNARTASASAHSWRVRGVSLPGYSHLRDGVECQDAYRHTFSESAGAHVLAVADGAGSRARSAEGAALAVGLATSLVIERLESRGVPDSGERWRSLLAGGCEAVVSTFVETAARMGPNPAEFAATLTAVVLAYPWAGVFSIGDGVVIARADGHDGADTFHLVSSADAAGEYVNETVFLTSADALGQASVDCVYDPGLTAVLLATDGLAPAAIRRNGGRRQANRSFLAPLLDSLDDPTQIARFLLEDRISALSADDKTLLMAVTT
jgi:protein phosphatase 2C-like protein